MRTAETEVAHHRPPDRPPVRRPRRAAAALIAAGVIAGGAAGALGGMLAAGDRPPAPVAAQSTATETPRSPAPQTGTLDVPALLRNVLPTVVSIQTERAGGGGGAGTGILLSAGGEVLTNAHVIDQATKITATRYGTTDTLDAHLVGAMPADDLALVQIDRAHDLPAATLGESAAVAVGSPVIAVGNALGISPGTPTVTQGIVSASGRTLTTVVHGRTVTLEGMLQTDAAINPGNSGGPLFDANGAVVGINTAVANGGGDTVAQGIGFAIPIDHAKELLAQLRAGGAPHQQQASPSYLGVTTITLTPPIRDAYGLIPETGVLITGVAGGSPAQRAGLAPGDVIVAADGKPITSAEQLAAVVSASKPGHPLKLQLVRGSTTTSATALLAAPPAAPPSAPPAAPPVRAG